MPNDKKNQSIFLIKKVGVNQQRVYLEVGRRGRVTSHDSFEGLRGKKQVRDEARANQKGG